MTEKHSAQRRSCSQETLQEGIFSLTLATAAAETARPGQFVNLYLNDRTHLLPRPISICEIDRDAGSLRLVYRVKGEGTREISDLVTGQTIDVMGPLGNGFPLDVKAGRPMVIGGGIGVPPMLGLFQKPSPERRPSFAAISTPPSCLMEFEAGGGTYRRHGVGPDRDPGQCPGCHAGASDLDPDIIYACGPKPMLAAVKAFAEEKGITCYISMEERMACGIGACLGCVVKTASVDGHSKVKNARVCADGPVFNAAEVDLT